ncbi:serine/threonine-protein kinase [Actinomycetospora termitidis]|uniref:non-specific serine/threonine protein kinase n=1 Tax=Actinomycetospora termitidis TaxID=3053470 RepID=A0ABT7M1A2_9PSEU|nr:serine/threonine-protein kinase [Actinomycetospora sp. Odt1-22]MDL5154434.1 serine/threonine-protein kinase [Actinomycetospora sp. Odt1-22]
MDGREFGRYRLGRLIGSGGMGDVYEAVDTERDRAVALKLLPELFGGNAEFVERFRRESRVAARLRDPHIIPIHDYGEIDGRLFIDMRLVDDGTTVADLLRDGGPLTVERTVDLIGQVADALDAAHADGLIHRDVKPSNVLVTARDFVYVVDFGIAHAAGHTASRVTGTGSTVGTLDYMAPERFTARSVDRRADVYSLACLLHQCLTARPPFEGEDLPELMYAHLDREPPRPSEHRPWIPTALDEVVARGMAKDPERRFPTAGALADAARAAVAPERDPASERPAGPAPSSASVVGPSRGAAPSREPLPVPPRRASDRPVPSADATTVGSAPSRGPARPVRYRRDGTTVRVPRLAVLGRRRHRVLLAALVVTVLVAVVVGLTLLLRPTPAPAAATVPPGGSGGLRSSATPLVVGAISTPPTPGYLAVTPDGRQGWVTNRDTRVVSVVDLDRQAIVATVPMTVATPRFVAFSADGTRAFVSCYDERGDVVEVIDTRSATVVATIPVDREPYALAVAPDQRTLWVPSHETGSLDLVDLATNAVARRVPVAPNPHWVAFGAGGTYVANHESNLVSVLGPDASTRTTVPVGRSPHALAISPDGTQVAVANYDGDTVSLIDTRTNRVVAEVPVGRGPQHVAWSADGEHLYTADVDGGTVTAVDTRTAAATATVPVCSSPTSVTLRGPDALVTCLDEARLVVLRAAG